MSTVWKSGLDQEAPATDPAGKIRVGPVQGGRSRQAGLFNRLCESNAAVESIAALFAAGVRLVYATNRLTFEPKSSEAIFAEYAPFIGTCWHGLSYMLPLVRPSSQPADVLVSRTGEAEKIARMLMKLGCGVIRGSGASRRSRMFEEGSVSGFRAMKAALDQGRTVFMTADFLDGGHQSVSPGIIRLAKLSGRPIVPVAFASSRRHEKKAWDRTVVSLPFGHSACVFGSSITVPPGADDTILEGKRQELNATLHAVAGRAHEIVAGKRG